MSVNWRLLHNSEGYIKIQGSEITIGKEVQTDHLRFEDMGSHKEVYLVTGNKEIKLLLAQSIGYLL